MNNAQIAETFENIAGLVEMKGEQRYTVVAYQRVARTIDNFPVELEQMVRDHEDLKEIPGIGKAIAQKITQLVETGKMDLYERLRSEFPHGILDVMRVPGVGPKTTKRLWDELGIATIAQLERAAEDGTLASLPRLGDKKAENILREVRISRTKDDRIPIARAMPAADRVIAALRSRCPGIHKLEAAGSLRRFEETIGDIDLVCTAGDPDKVLDAMVGLPNVSQVLAHGDTKVSVVLSEGIQVDLRVVEDRHFGALLQYFTGDKYHNIQLREHAVKMGLSLNEYGLTGENADGLEEFEDETSLYARLGLQYIPPELRRGQRELGEAKARAIPRLLELGDIKGDLHVHTDWSDGRDPMELMVAAARDRGYEYVAITDHSVGRGIAGGLTVERLEQHAALVREVDGRVGGIKVLAGSEVDIRADGSLDFSDEVLAGLDWVVASVHSGLGQEPDVITRRIIRAIRNPRVTAIGHPSGRMIGERRPIEADFEAIFSAAAETGTALEINASPERLDLKDAHIYRARELGVPLVIDSDAHTVEGLDNQRYGVAIARRGWCEPRHILNTLPLAEFTGRLARGEPSGRRELAAHA